VHPLRHLEACQLPPTAFPDGIRRHIRTRSYDSQLRHLAKQFVRHRERRALFDRGQAADDPFDFPGEDVLAADIDHVFFPADDVKLVVGVEKAKIAAAIKTVGGKARDSGFELSLQHVAVKDRGAPDRDFADGARIEASVVLINDLEFKPGSTDSPSTEGLRLSFLKATWQVASVMP